MRIVFVGSVEFSWHCLREICLVGGNVAAAFGVHEDHSGGISDFRAFDDLAAEFGFPLCKFHKINSHRTIQRIREFAPDVIFVLGLSQVIGDEILEIPPAGCIGSHPALLPRNRGRAAIPWAIIKRLPKSGLTFFYLTPGVDDGDIAAQKEFEITPSDTATTLYGKIIELGKEMIRELVPALAAGTALCTPQDHSRANYWPKRTPEDGLIHWDADAIDIYNLVRAVTHPYPGAFTYVDGRKIIVWGAALEEEDGDRGEPGEVLSVSVEGITVAAGKGAVRLFYLEADGKTVDAFDLNVIPGSVLDCLSAVP